MNGPISQAMDIDVPPDDISDPSICLPSCDNKSIIHLGQPGFAEQMSKYYEPDEMTARHQVTGLKHKLQTLQGEDFWGTLMRGMADITGAQYAFVAKRILKSDTITPVEMPPLGQEGSCLMGLAYFVRHHDGTEAMFRDIQYKGYKCPCAHMRHDKTLMIPERLHEMFHDNPNAPAMPIEEEAYLAIPLFTESKCYGHVGVMWSKQGLDTRPGLSWAFLEMFMKTLEDLITWRILQKPGNPGDLSHRPWNPFMGNVVLNEDVTPQQTIRPAARNLSHELRTPLQGVVGMLDVMLASLDSIQEEPSPADLRQFVFDMRKNIENCQDSAQRVVDAADNMVHALDLNSEIGAEPVSALAPSIPRPEIQASLAKKTLEYTVLPAIENKKKRKRTPSDGSINIGPPTPLPPGRARTPPPTHKRSFHNIRGGRATSMPPEGFNSRDIDDSLNRPGSVLPLPPTGPTPSGTHTIHQEASGQVTLNHKRLNLIEFISGMLQVALKSGGRPEKVQVVPNKWGEVVMATRRTGTLKIDWSVEFVPPMLIIDKLTLEKTLYAVLHNAVKFTPCGDVKLVATVTQDAKFVHFKITDTGPGIQSDFVPHVFRMWRREDNSLTRAFDGVGLGLFVAKRLAIRLGGDITLVSTTNDGSKTGSEFQIVLPIEMGKDSKHGRSGSPAIAARKPIDRSTSTQGLNSPEFPRPASSSNEVVSPAITNHTWNGFQQSPVHPSQEEDEPPIPYRPRKQSLTLRQPVNGTHAVRKASFSSRKGPFDKELGKKIPLRILVVEDNHINRNLIVSMLKRLGFQDILEAGDGEDAVQLMELEHEKPINLILMDLWMPRMNGIQATERILAMPKYNRVNGETDKNGLTVLAVSADASPDAHRDIIRVGMQGFLKKPHTISALEQLIIDNFRNGYSTTAATM